MITPPDRAAALEQALGRPWYHTIELAPGRATAGAVDLRSVAPKVLPADLSGRRALDVGTFDGFWAFELERRGAEDVVAVDLDSHESTDWPPIHRERLAREVQESGARPGERFSIAADLLGSGVRRVGTSVYDLHPEPLGGRFDYAVLGALLLHLRDPVRGLDHVRSVLRDDGRLLLVEPFDAALTLYPPRRPRAELQAVASDFNWWRGNLACLKSWLTLAGFGPAERKKIFRLKAVKPMRHWYVALEASPRR